MKKIDGLAVSMETIEDGTGSTVLVWEKPASPGGGGADVIIGSYDFLMGIAPGQTLRLNVFHPKDEQKGATSLKTLAVQMTLHDARGKVIAQTTGSAIPEGEFRSFDFNRAATPLPGEPGTGRLQMRAVVEVRFDRLNLVQFTVEMSGEVMDNGTGKTAVLISQKPKEIVVVGSK